MLNFLTENLSTILVGAVVFGVLAVVVVRMIQNRRIKKSPCGSCCNCPSAGICHPTGSQN